MLSKSIQIQLVKNVGFFEKIEEVQRNFSEQYFERIQLKNLLSNICQIKAVLQHKKCSKESGSFHGIQKGGHSLLLRTRES